MKHSIFAWSAVALFASSSLVGCVVEETDVNNRDGGVAGKGSGGNGATGGTSTAGTGGSSAGSGGTAGATGGTGGSSGGTGGTTGGTGGTTGGTGGTGGASCYGDTASTTPDCANLPYASTQCDDNGTTVPAYGNVVCQYSKLYARDGVFEGVYDCLNALSGDACSTTHDAAANDCYANAFGNACPASMVATCDQYEEACTGLKADCESIMDGYSQAAQQQIKDCFNAGTGACADDFAECVADPTANTSSN